MLSCYVVTGSFKVATPSHTIIAGINSDFLRGSLAMEGLFLWGICGTKKESCGKCSSKEVARLLIREKPMEELS